jgi:geranyl-CoA carboxylase alpha subunit
MSIIKPTFKRILIANRGEIALRIMRTAKEKGLHTIAVFSDADANSPHTRFADEAWCLGGAAPKDSYLHIQRIINVAKQSGAQAIHPGYGFLAENAAFAKASVDAGLTFIGPSAKAIAAMGDKANAKQLMRAAGVPCIEGYDGSDQNAASLAMHADSIGYPLMIKAAAGGGGRGMRLVKAKTDFLAHLQSAQSEASSAFGDATVLLEKAVINPRHIEIQIVADRLGNVIHLGERDCSIQRRHQKIIEEAPSPAVSEALRNEMGAISIKAAKAIQYEGVGTFEFLLDESGKFYFMEMNTRLQVEHPVTEAITGLDLVAMQIDIANGIPLALKQEEVSFHGHAIEVRLCAEDADTQFTPQSGEMLQWQVPKGIRVEHALEPGSVITPYYDSMIAKMISHGATRCEALDKLSSGLNELVALGIATNQDFLRACLSNNHFVSGKFNTSFIAQHFDDLVATSANGHAISESVVAAALLFSLSGNKHSRQLQHGYPVNLNFSMQSAQQVTIVQTRGGLQVNGQIVSIHIESNDSAVGFSTISDGEQSHRVAYAMHSNTLYFRYCAKNYLATDRRFLPARSANAQIHDGLCKASTNGKVVAVMVKAGDMVEIGQSLVTLEAMKMEHIHIAKVKGQVDTVDVKLGDQVKQRQQLVSIKPTA